MYISSDLVAHCESVGVCTNETCLCVITLHVLCHVTDGGSSRLALSRKLLAIFLAHANNLFHLFVLTENVRIDMFMAMKIMNKFMTRVSVDL